MSKKRPMECALDATVSSARTKMVLVVMARRGNQSGICFMSQRSIASEANCSVKSVERAIKELIGRGLIEEVFPRSRSRRSKTYWLCITEDENRHFVDASPTH